MVVSSAEQLIDHQWDGDSRAAVSRCRRTTHVMPNLPSITLSVTPTRAQSAAYALSIGDALTQRMFARTRMSNVAPPQASR